MDLTEYVATLPSGDHFHVLTDEEVDWVHHQSRRYEKELEFTQTIDLTALDRLITWELIHRRYSLWLGAQKNYSQESVTPQDVRSFLVAAQKEIHAAQKALGIDKIARDKAKGEGSVAAFIFALLTRAKAFGIMRERQLNRAIELVFQLITLVVFFRNISEDERDVAKFQVDEKFIINWIETVLIPEFKEIDEHFRRTEQQYWTTSPVGGN